MLTCKSLFGLGYRGERLIEPFAIRWLRVVVKAAASGLELRSKFARLSNCRDVLISCWYRQLWETTARHLRETWGYGNNPTDRDNRQPSPKGFMPMDAVHRLDGSRLCQRRA